MNRLILLLFAITTSACRLSAQTRSELFIPWEVYKYPSVSLTLKIEEVRAVLTNDCNNMALSLGGKYRMPCENRISPLMRILRTEILVKNDSIEAMLRDLFRELRRNTDTPDPTVLIFNTPVVNAACYSKNVFIVSVGLLGRVRSLGELSFIIGHELAHGYLGHVEENIKRAVDSKLNAQQKKFYAKLSEGELSLEDLQQLRDLVYANSRFSRENEKEADSIGFNLLRGAGHAPDEAVNALATLDSVYAPKYDYSDFFSPLHFSKYPFQEAWLAKRLEVFYRDGSETGSRLIESDSIETHPDLAIRKEELSRRFVAGTMFTIPTNEMFEKLSAAAEFQGVEAAYQSIDYDKCLFQILQLLHRYPGHPYLVSRCTKILTDLYDVKNENRLFSYTSKFIGHYGTKLQQVNCFLYNTTKEEIIEVAYHFINNSSNFNKEDPSHHYLLWNICKMTGRGSTQEKVATSYSQKFGGNIMFYRYK